MTRIIGLGLLLTTVLSSTVMAQGSRDVLRLDDPKQKASIYREEDLVRYPWRTVEEGRIRRAQEAAQVEARRLARARAVAAGRRQVQFAGDNRHITLESPEPEISEPDEEEELPIALPIRVRINLQTAVLDRENFDRWLFGESQTEPSRLGQLNRMLEDEVADAARKLDLTEPEKAKLLLAGRGDIKRLMDRVDEERRKFEDSRKNFTRGQATLRGLEPLAADFQGGPFGTRSLFAKTLRKIREGRPPGR